MIADVVVGMIIGGVILANVAAGYWHGERMYSLGVGHGRELEAMETRHARERIVEQAQRRAVEEALKS